jgi:hypothetical protein
MDTGSIEFQQFDLLGIFAGTEDDAEWQFSSGSRSFCASQRR